MATTVNLYETIKQNMLKLIREANPTTNLTNVDSFSITGGGVLTNPEVVTIDGVDVVLDTYVDIKGNPYYGFTGDVRFKYKRIDLSQLEAFQDTVSILAIPDTSNYFNDILQGYYTTGTQWFNNTNSSLSTSTMALKSKNDGLTNVIGGGTTILDTFDINREATFYEGGNNRYCNLVVTTHFFNINRYALLRSAFSRAGNNANLMRGYMEFGENQAWFDETNQPTSKFLYKGRFLAKIDYK